MDAFVADASIAVAWVHPAQATRKSAAWLDRIALGAEVVVPALWPLEVSNALLVLQRRRKITLRERQQALELLRAVPFVIDPDAAGNAFAGLSALATAESLSVYDACYLDVAMRHQLPLACKDGPLRRAAVRKGIRVDE